MRTMTYTALLCGLIGPSLSATAAAQDGFGWSSAIETDAVRVSVQGVPADPSSYVFQLFVNTGDPATGEKHFKWPTNSGADFAVEGNPAYYRSKHWEGSAWGMQVVEPIDVTSSGTTLDIRIPFSVLRLASWDRPIGVGFLLMDQNWKPTAQLPSTSQFMQHDPAGRIWNADYCRWYDELPPALPPIVETPVCTLEGSNPFARQGQPEFTPKAGIVVPAYFGPDDSAATNKPWQSLLEHAVALKNANPLRDLFVAAVGGDKQAPRTRAEFDAYAPMWDPIREQAQGRIFGYVATCENCLEATVGRKYKSLDALKAEITRWVCGYPQLDGLWIDEFYPRYEIAEDEETKPSFPNGSNNAPLDRCFVDRDGSIHGSVQINPEGGFFDQLLTWIKVTYPQLRIIGNAGGALRNNQHRYADDLDLLVSFEQSYTHHITPPSMGGAPLNPALADVQVPQLALIHATPLDHLPEMFDLATSDLYGYTHIYVTDDVMPNPWDQLPTYFAAELEQLAR